MSDWEPDMDGDYPTEETLAELQEYLNEDWSGERVGELKRRFIHAIWTFAEYCFYAESEWVDIEVRGDTSLHLGFHTGGWSGAEDFINAISAWNNGSGLAWMMYLDRTDRGGHYYFDVRDEDA